MLQKTKLSLNDFQHFMDDTYSVGSFIDLLQNMLDDEIAINFARSNALDDTQCQINAYYDPVSDEIDEQCIEIQLIISDTRKSFYINDSINYIINEINKSLDHELYHQYQYRIRDFVPNRTYKSDSSDERMRKVQTYMGDTDEIGAYALNIISSIETVYGTDARNKLSSYHTLSETRIDGSLVSPDLFAYMQIFDKNSDVIKRLMKKVACHFLDKEMI